MNILCGHPGETKESYQKTFNKLYEMVLKGEIKLNQINIRYYHSFPGTNLYNQRNFYKDSFGTEIHFEEWWKNIELLKYGPFCVKPSKDLTIHDSFNIYTDHYKELLVIGKNSIKNKNISNKFPLLITIKEQIKTLENKREEFFRFLQRYEIETGNSYQKVIQ